MRYYHFLTGLLILALSIGVSAQGIGLGPQVGYFKSKGADDGNFTFGGALRMKLSPALGVEGSINYRQEKFVDDQVTVKNWPIMVTGLFYPLPIAYGAAGAGWYNTTIDYDEALGINGPEDETSRDFGWHFGGGLELPMGDSKLFADVRYVFIDYNFDALPGSSDIESNFYVMSVGMLFHL